MRIEELVIEGFKSYPVRTQITGWDPSFNAITGLNGSGKSNILDAICFVLGMTNMSSMRAQNQQDLIYKRGQAGVTKASVTIVFDNSDRSKSPPGMEEAKQITVTRQIALPAVSKYLVNGHKSTQAHVQTIFQSVQLNINNPHFLIMQGRITKVLNMRPQEILGMVEEAAGTRMFEEKKDKAKKTMAKKDKRVQEIQSILNEEITPKLEKQKAEKRAYIEYQKACSKLERISRMLRAYEWTHANKMVEEKERAIEEKQAEGAQVEKQKKQYGKECDAAEKQHKEVTKKKEGEISKGGKIKKLEDEVAELGKAAVKVRTQAELKENTIKEEEAGVAAIEGELKELEDSKDRKAAEVQGLNSTFSKVKEQYTANQTKLATAEELLQSLLTGLTSNSNANTGGGYMGQLADARGRISQAEAEEQQSKVKLGMAEKELKSLEGRTKEVQKEAKENEKKLERVQGELDECRRRLEKCGWNAELDQAGEERLRIAKQELRSLTERYEQVKRQLGRIDFSYSDPSPGFDRSKVKGTAAQLISLDEEHFNKATALEIAAGGKLYQIVVENERVGKEILERGGLRKRVTLIPLNKIAARRLDARRLEAAQRLAPGKVWSALSLVGYAAQVAEAIAYVFSDNLICSDSEAAKKVTFSRDVGVRSVTFEGDVYDPAGTLSGGSAPSGSGILIQVQELLAVTEHLSQGRARMDALMAEEENGRQKREDWKKMKRDLEMKEHEMNLVKQQIEGSSAARIGAQVEELKQTISNLRAAIDEAKRKQKEANDEVKKLEKDMAEFKNNKEGKTEQLKADILKQKAALQKENVTVKTQQKEVQTANLELGKTELSNLPGLKQFDTDISETEARLEEARESVKKARKELVKMQNTAAQSEAAHAEAEQRLQEERATLSRFDDELKQLSAVIKEKKQKMSDADLQLKEFEHDIQVLNKDKQGHVNMVTNLEKQHEWIVEDKDQFGKEGTPYDFKKENIGRLKEQANELETAQRGMKKKVNHKVLSTLDGTEKREAELQKNMRIVLEDRGKIEATIDQIDQYKREALMKTWKKVDADFGAIFAELLPGNYAKLQPPEGQDLMDGLEVKVQLGSVWKQSLTELSGGQRSLIALSLIMALLQFKPAPMYILDEIDAALDLSHTQHIGQLFRTRFKGSQFIVVSLKEGLFTNANVLFKARFRDGTSIVERTAQRSGSSMYGTDNEDHGNGRRRRVNGS